MLPKSACSSTRSLPSKGTSKSGPYPPFRPSSRLQCQIRRPLLLSTALQPTCFPPPQTLILFPHATPAPHLQRIPHPRHFPAPTHCHRSLRALPRLGILHFLRCAIHRETTRSVQRCRAGVLQQLAEASKAYAACRSCGGKCGK